MKIISTKAEAEEYIDKLRDELITAYMVAFSLLSDNKAENTRAIGKAMRDFISQRMGWTRGDVEHFFMFMGKHTFLFETVMWSVKGLAWIPIETAKNIARWELEEMVQTQSEQEKTDIIAHSIQYIEKTEWIFPFIRRNINEGHNKNTMNEFKIVEKITDKPWLSLVVAIVLFFGQTYLPTPSNWLAQIWMNAFATFCIIAAFFFLFKGVSKAMRRKEEKWRKNKQQN